LGDLTNIPIVFTWSAIDTDLDPGVVSYPAFLRFRIQVETSDAVVEQPMVIRVLGPNVPRAAELTGNN